MSDDESRQVHNISPSTNGNNQEITKFDICNSSKRDLWVGTQQLVLKIKPVKKPVKKPHLRSVLLMYRSTHYFRTSVLQDGVALHSFSSLIYLFNSCVVNFRHSVSFLHKPLRQF